MTRALLLLVTLAAAPALAGHNVVPLKKDHFLDLRIYYGQTLDGTYDAWGRFWYSASASDTPHDFFHPGYGKAALPFASFIVHGKWWIAVGELIHNPQITWRWDDRFFAGSQQLDRAQLEEFPDLARRLAGARFSFAKMKVQLKGKLDSGATVQLTFIHDGVEFLIPAEGKKPYAVPGSPLKWSQVLTIDGREAQSDKQLRDTWKRLVSVTEPSVWFEGFQLPWSELEAIGLEYKERKKKKDELKKEYAAVLEDKSAPVKPYRGGGEEAEPFEGQPPVARRDDAAKTMKLETKSGTLVKSWPLSEVYGLEPIAGTRSFAAQTSKGKRLTNARGEFQSVGGETTFDEISFANSRYTLRKVERKRTMNARGCYSGRVKGKRFSSEYSTVSEIERATEDWERDDLEKRRQRGEGPPTGIIFLLGCNVGPTHVREWVTDSALKTLSTDDWWEAR